jgi:hypothetical protein
MSSAKVTIDHDEIRSWVEERGGHPAHVKRGSEKGDLGILRIDFPGYSGEDTLERVEWDQWFEAFDNDGLAFLHQDETADGSESRFSKLVSRDSEQVIELAQKQEKSAGSSSKGKAAAGAGSKKKSAKN